MRRASGKGALADAVAHYERALASARRLPDAPVGEVAATWVQLSIDAGIAGDHERSRAALRVARRLLADDPLALAGLCFREARLANAHGRSRDVVRWIRRGLRHLEGRNDTEASSRRARLLSLYAYTRQQFGRPREAIAEARRIIEVEGPGPTSRSALAQAYLVLDWANIDLGRADLATNAPAAIELLEAEGEFGELAIALNTLGAFAFFQGRWQDALDLYERSTTSFERIGDVADAALSVANRAEILTLQGRLDEAERLLEEVIELWRSLRFPYGLATATRHLARIQLRRGEIDAALAVFRSARETFAAYQQAGKLVEIDAWIAERLLRRGDIAGPSRWWRTPSSGACRRRHRDDSDAPAPGRLCRRGATPPRRCLGCVRCQPSRRSEPRCELRRRPCPRGYLRRPQLGGPVAEGAVEREHERQALLDELGVTVAVPPPIALSA